MPLPFNAFSFPLLSNLTVSFDGSSIFPGSKAHNLPVFFESEPPLETYVNKIIYGTVLVSSQ